MAVRSASYVPTSVYLETMDRHLSRFKSWLAEKILSGWNRYRADHRSKTSGVGILTRSIRDDQGYCVSDCTRTRVENTKVADADTDCVEGTAIGEGPASFGERPNRKLFDIATLNQAAPSQRRAAGSDLLHW